MPNFWIVVMMIRAPTLDRGLQVARCAVDLLHNALGLLEARDGVLELPVENHPISHDDGRVEDRLICMVMQVDDLVRGSGDRVGLPRSCRVLNQVVLPGTVDLCMGKDVAHGVELMKPREDHHLAALSFLEVDESAEKVEEHVAREDGR